MVPKVYRDLSTLALLNDISNPSTKGFLEILSNVLAYFSRMKGQTSHAVALH